MKKERKRLLRGIWRVLEAYGCLDRLKKPYMQNRRNELFGDLMKAFELEEVYKKYKAKVKNYE